MLFVVAVVTSVCLSTSCLADEISDKLTALSAKVDTIESMLSLFVQKELESNVGGRNPRRTDKHHDRAKYIFVLGLAKRSEFQSE